MLWARLFSNFPPSTPSRHTPSYPRRYYRSWLASSCKWTRRRQAWVARLGGSLLGLCAEKRPQCKLEGNRVWEWKGARSRTWGRAALSLTLFESRSHFQAGAVLQVQQFPPPSDLGRLLPLSFPPHRLSSISAHHRKKKRRKKEKKKKEVTAKDDSTRSNDMATISMSSPLASSDPTITAHDWRFPRRPEDEQADSGADIMKFEQSEASPVSSSQRTGTASPIITNKTQPGAKDKPAARNPLKQLRFDLSDTIDVAQRRLSEVEALHGFNDGLAGMSSSPEEMAKEDPLATQVWRFFAKAKQNLPNQERMENITWRMMAVSLRKQSQQAQQSNK